jgi:hypothetical protein
MHNTQPNVKTEDDAIAILRELSDNSNEQAFNRLKEKAHWYNLPLVVAVQQYGDPRTWDTV